MNQPELEPMPMTLDVRLADASNLPLHHVNVVGIRFARDEFFVTLGVVMPPDPPEIAAAQQVGFLEAQPVFRFALSRETMEKFLAMLAPTTEELLSGPLFQVAGMFEIDEPGWADKHDEYLAETYL